LLNTADPHGFSIGENFKAKFTGQCSLAVRELENLGKLTSTASFASRKAPPFFSFKTASRALKNVKQA